MAVDCNARLVERKRPFWATQPCACPSTVDACGQECCTPGLTFVDSPQGRTLATDNWILGLVLNILNTEKRIPNNLCGVNPMAIKGHWSESFIDGGFGLYGGAAEGYRVGTGLYQLDTTKMRVNEAIAHIEAVLQTDMQKLVGLGVATSVSVTAEYLGRQRIAVEIVVEGPAGSPAARVALIGNKTADMGYYWSV